MHQDGHDQRLVVQIKRSHDSTASPTCKMSHSSHPSLYPLKCKFTCQYHICCAFFIFQLLGITFSLCFCLPSPTFDKLQFAVLDLHKHQTPNSRKHNQPWNHKTPKCNHQAVKLWTEAAQIGNRPI